MFCLGQYSIIVLAVGSAYDYESDVALRQSSSACVLREVPGFRPSLYQISPQLVPDFAPACTRSRSSSSFEPLWLECLHHQQTRPAHMNVGAHLHGITCVLDWRIARMTTSRMCFPIRGVDMKRLCRWLAQYGFFVNAPAVERQNEDDTVIVDYWRGHLLQQTASIFSQDGTVKCVDRLQSGTDCMDPEVRRSHSSSYWDFFCVVFIDHGIQLNGIHTWELSVSGIASDLWWCIFATQFMAVGPASWQASQLVSKKYPGQWIQRIVVIHSFA